MSESDRRFAAQNRLRRLLERREAMKKEKAKEQQIPLTPEEIEANRLKTAQAIQELLSLHDSQQRSIAQEKDRYKVVTNSMLFDTNKNQGSKVNPSTYYYREDPAHDAYAAANIHHTGSHYVMAGTKQFLKGVRVKGVVSRHSKQAAIRNGNNNRQKQNAVNGVHNKKSGSMAVLM